MRCLYCGKELALLKRLTGGGEFCSEAHKQSYQEEYNRLALSRLLQAQKKKGQQANSQGQNAEPPATAVAVAESAPELSSESPAADAELEQPAAQALPLEIEPEPVPEAAPALAAEPNEAEPAALAELEQMDPASFLLECPAATASTEPQPYQEPQAELALSPALLKWQPENPGTLELSEANLQALDAALNACSIEDRTPSADLSAQAWPSAQPHRMVSSLPSGNRAADNRLGSGGAIAVPIAPLAADPASDQTLVLPLAFEGAVLVSSSEFLDLSPASIDFPTADADVVVPQRSHDRRQDSPVEDTTPRSSLEALSRLHHEMIEEREVQAQALPESVPPEDVQPEQSAPVESVAAAPEVSAAPPEDSAAHEQRDQPATIDIVADHVVADAPEPAEQDSRPTFATEILEISLRIFPPSKGTARAGELLPVPTAPLLPHLKALPLRPKIALARGYTPGAPAGAETPATPAAPLRKPAPRPPAKPSAPLAKPGQSVAAKSPSVRESAKPAAPPAPPSPPAAVAKAEAPSIDKAPPAQPAPASQEIKAPQAKASEAKIPEVKVLEVKVPEVKKTEPLRYTTEPAKPATQIKPEPSKRESSKPDASKSETSKPDPAKSESQRSPYVRPEPPRREAARSESGKEDVPSFGIGPANIAWYGSLKVKLGIAILLLLIACVYFLGWGGGKSHRPASSTAASGDGSGPSIMLGEGGWVEGWGGDPSGLRVGRQITIYRPSLKLSDYRIEFQATIDVKSIGWVFRAADPENYYAMKIATVSSALPLKVALFKYLVSDGRQTQVGRVPIDLTVHPETTFNIREDVRGPHFTTYIQGQQIDSWTDDQLKVGGVGFLNEREERGKVSSVSIRYLTGGK